MTSEYTPVLLAIVVVNVFMVLVAATNPSVKTDKSNDEMLADLLADEDLLQFEKMRGQRGRPLHNVTKQTASSSVQTHAMVMQNLIFEKPELDIFVQEEEFLLPTDTELRHHIRKRQVVTEEGGSGNVADGVQTRVTLNQPFNAAISGAIRTAAEAMVLSSYTAVEMNQASLTVTVTNDQNGGTLITFLTMFESVNNRILVAYAFKKDIKGRTIGGYSQKAEPTVLNAASVLKTVTCFLCPADRPCGTGTECAPFSTVVNSDLFPWGFHSCDDKLLHGLDPISGPIEMGFDFIFNTEAQTFVYTGDNGILSFTTTSGSGVNPNSLTDITSRTDAFICAFCKDVDLRNAGRSADVFYNFYDVGDEDAIPILERATNEARVLDSDFEAQAVGVFTWFDVPYFETVSTTVSSTQRNLFQAVLITNGAKSYVLIFYKDMEWSQSLQDNAVASFKHVDTSVLQNYLRVKTDGDQRVQASFDTFTGNTGVTGKFLLPTGELTTVSATTTAKQACATWYKGNIALKSQFLASVTAMPRCPCSEVLVQNNNNFANTSDENSLQCYDLIRDDTTNDGLRCCYRDQVLAADSPHSRYLRFRNGKDAYSESEVVSLANCCTNSDLCSLFTEVRPLLTCSAGSGASSSSCHGDPHINTLDGLTYTFNGYGEYTMFELDAMAVQDFQFKFKLQARTVPAKTMSGTDSQATIFQAFAAVLEGSNGGSFHAEMNMERNKLVLYVNDIDIGNSFYESTGYNKNIGKLNVKRTATDTAQFTFPASEIAVTVTLIAETLALETYLPTKYYTLTKGLMGKFDGNSQNDLEKANGVAIPVNSDDSVIFEMGETWRVTIDTSILRYENGKTFANSNKLNFQPIFFDQISDAVKQASLNVCSIITNEPCILDYVATGNQGLASATTDIQKEAEVTKAILTNKPPTLTGPEIINAEIRNTVTLNFQSTDPDGDSRTFLANLKPSSGFTINAQDGTMTWTPADSLPVSIVVNAEDSKGLASEPINVRIVLCEGCQNGGTCDYTTTRASTADNPPETFKLSSCKCTTGWGGADCSQDLDGCASVPCFTPRTCADVSAAEQATSGNAFICGPCPSGYQDDSGSTKCLDVNECTANTHGCPANSQCQNTDGGFLCNCNSGLRKQGAICTDINECAERSDGCGHTCINTEGSFTCECRQGFSLAADQKACTASSTAPPSCGSKGCTGICAEVDGTATCFCDAGYKLNADQKTCSDIDECGLNICAQKCDNTPGSFTCSCYSGFQLDADDHSCTKCLVPKWGPSCGNTCTCNGHESSCDAVKGCVCTSGWTGVNCNTDIDECTLNPNICGFTQHCKNVDGGYECNCPAGYSKSGTGCTDMNECTAAVSPCPVNSQCVNSEGSYSCNCNVGYSKVGSNCEDVNECTNGLSNCEQSCQNKAGSYNCQCNTGYILNDDRRTCLNFGDDPCMGQGGCQDFCVLVNGVATCRCKIGYKLASDNRACDDVNECADNSLNMCTDKSTCRNTAGGFECSCPSGQRLKNDGRTCVACDGNHWGLNCANVCGCSSLGSVSCNSETGCVCKTGWTGDKCDTDKDECTTATCQANSDCQNLPGTYRCKCRTGFNESAAGNTCEDIDECAKSDDNECDNMCTNTVGSYTCTCNDGFVLAGKGTCNDINECDLGTSGCPQLCRNTVGGYSCSCYEGYTINPVNSKECIQSSSSVCITPKLSQCIQNCRRLTGGTEQCFCNTGYTLNTDTITCDDIKECQLDPPRCSQTCTETPGSYTCSCDPGFKLAADTTTCSPCEAGTYGDNCTDICTCDSSNSIACNGTDGSCTCRTGWTGGNCTDDVKECTDTPNICGNNGVCNEKDGTYTCTCEAGFIRSSDACTPCDSKHYGANCAQTCACDQTNSISCRDTDGFCTCKPEWQGATCTQDVNECNNASACTGNNETCNNTPGSFECNCDAGFVKAPNDTCIPCNFGYYGAGCSTQCSCVADHFESCDNLVGTCTCKSGWNDTTCDNNINECDNTDSPVCTGNLEVCRDTAGSYECDCETGHYKAPNNTCIVCDKGKYGSNCSLDCPCTANNFESCNNLNGSCTCSVGWSGDNCDVDINECQQTTPPVCNAAISTCRNTDGSYVCDCKTGYNNSADGSCTDIDECAANSSNNCIYLCNNTIGSFFCSCPLGFSGTGNRCTGVYRTYHTEITLNMDRSAILSGSKTSPAWKNLAAAIVNLVNDIIRAILQAAFVPCVVLDMKSGSIIASVELRVDPTKTSDDPDASAAAAIKALASTPSVTVDGTAAALTQVTYNGTTILTTMSACDMLKLIKNLASDEYCELRSDGIPVVRKLPSTDTNIPLIVGLTVPIALILGVLLALIIFVCCCKKSTSSQRTPSEEGRDNAPFRSAFVGNLPTKGNFGASRYMMYSPHTLSETASQASGDSGFRYTRAKNLEGRSDFMDMPGPSERQGFYPITPRDDAVDRNARSNFSWENMFNMLEPSRNAQFEVPRPNVTNSPNRVYRNGRFRDSLA